MQEVQGLIFLTVLALIHARVAYFPWSVDILSSHTLNLVDYSYFLVLEQFIEGECHNLLQICS